MELEVLKILAPQGIFAVLFCYLLLYVLKENAKREEKLIDQNDVRESKYQEIIAKLTDKFNIVEDIKRDVDDIKDMVFNGRN